VMFRDMARSISARCKFAQLRQRSVPGDGGKGRSPRAAPGKAAA
jgi:hypothetical protein